MHGPNGAEYPNRVVFQEIGPERIVLRHDNRPHFILTGTFESADGGTEVTFRQTFETEKEYIQFKPICEEANEQNLDRLGSLLKTIS